MTNSMDFIHTTQFKMFFLNVTDSWRRAIDETKFTAAAFWDISKAFDCVNHDILLSKFACFGILELSLVWFASY